MTTAGPCLASGHRKALLPTQALAPLRRLSCLELDVPWRTDIWGFASLTSLPALRDLTLSETGRKGGSRRAYIEPTADQYRDLQALSLLS